MRCAECDEVISNPPLRLEHGGDPVLFCSFECLITYSVGQVQQRLEHQNRRWRVLAEEQSHCLGARAIPSVSHKRAASSPVGCARLGRPRRTRSTRSPEA